MQRLARTGAVHLDLGKLQAAKTFELNSDVAASGTANWNRCHAVLLDQAALPSGTIASVDKGGGHWFISNKDPARPLTLHTIRANVHDNGVDLECHAKVDLPPSPALSTCVGDTVDARETVAGARYGPFGTIVLVVPIDGVFRRAPPRMSGLAHTSSAHVLTAHPRLLARGKVFNRDGCYLCAIMQPLFSDSSPHIKKGISK
mmetsp:Transcript_109276/g.308326  ORF Transcript_109276/g.308326 Transcript_109276/m.308326 type:complete len:202 (+) Transcript_109276:63-668(+)|eukprot:CAMPEP_0117537946 /NCGR_PEP_ID=MMETSP0784-20121206/42228_1 /TAXON_ID=39447 /ORGANISM="" /LENGTH=201 /DNA_ID=CAMNT_0005334551 /DNA_START=57 /DNA_END=662 /DNA_ORIENTATION=-